MRSHLLHLDFCFGCSIPNLKLVYPCSNSKHSANKKHAPNKRKCMTKHKSTNVERKKCGHFQLKLEIIILNWGEGEGRKLRQFHAIVSGRKDSCRREACALGGTLYNAHNAHTNLINSIPMKKNINHSLVAHFIFFFVETSISSLSFQLGVFFLSSSFHFILRSSLFILSVIFI